MSTRVFRVSFPACTSRIPSCIPLGLGFVTKQEERQLPPRTSNDYRHALLESSSLHVDFYLVCLLKNNMKDKTFLIVYSESYKWREFDRTIRRERQICQTIWDLFVISHWILEGNGKYVDRAGELKGGRERWIRPRYIGYSMKIP